MRLGIQLETQDPALVQALQQVWLHGNEHIAIIVEGATYPAQVKFLKSHNEE